MGKVYGETAGEPTFANKIIMPDKKDWGTILYHLGNITQIVEETKTTKAEVTLLSLKQYIDSTSHFDREEYFEHMEGIIAEDGKYKFRNEDYFLWCQKQNSKTKLGEVRANLYSTQKMNIELINTFVFFVIKEEAWQKNES